MKLKFIFVLTFSFQEWILATNDMNPELKLFKESIMKRTRNPLGGLQFDLNEIPIDDDIDDTCPIVQNNHFQPHDIGNIQSIRYSEIDHRKPLGGQGEHLGRVDDYTVPAFFGKPYAPENIYHSSENITGQRDSDFTQDLGVSDILLLLSESNPNSNTDHGKRTRPTVSELQKGRCKIPRYHCPDDGSNMEAFNEESRSRSIVAEPFITHKKFPTSSNESNGNIAMSTYMVGGVLPETNVPTKGTFELGEHISKRKSLLHAQYHSGSDPTKALKNKRPRGDCDMKGLRTSDELLSDESHSPEKGYISASVLPHDKEDTGQNHTKHDKFQPGWAKTKKRSGIARKTRQIPWQEESNTSKRRGEASGNHGFDRGSGKTITNAISKLYELRLDYKEKKRNIRKSAIITSEMRARYMSKWRGSCQEDMKKSSWERFDFVKEYTIYESSMRTIPYSKKVLSELSSNGDMQSRRMKKGGKNTKEIIYNGTGAKNFYIIWKKQEREISSFPKYPRDVKCDKYFEAKPEWMPHQDIIQSMIRSRNHPKLLYCEHHLLCSAVDSTPSQAFMFNLIQKYHHWLGSNHKGNVFGWGNYSSFFDQKRCEWIHPTLR